MDITYFNPRVPCGTRPRIVENVKELLISIHGSRVGPDFHPLSTSNDGFISIHGSRVGPDKNLVSLVLSPLIFQSTGPVWDPTSTSS